MYIYSQVTNGNGACARYACNMRGDQIREGQAISEGITKTVQFRYERAGRLSEKRELIARWNEGGAKRSIQEAVTPYRRDTNGNCINMYSQRIMMLLSMMDLDIATATMRRIG